MIVLAFRDLGRDLVAQAHPHGEPLELDSRVAPRGSRVLLAVQAGREGSGDCQSSRARKQWLLRIIRWLRPLSVRFAYSGALSSDPRSRAHGRMP